MSLKKVFWLFAGGIVGAVAFACVSVVLGIFVGGACTALPFIGHLFEKLAKQWTLEGIYEVLIISSCIGFILGASGSDKYSQVVKKWFVSALIIGIPMAFCLWSFYGYAGHVDIPRSLKLADCTNTIRIHLKIPKGHYYRLALAVPLGTTNPFSGYINVSDCASAVTNLPISLKETEQQCNFLQAQSNYDIEITFKQPPPPSTSIWLHWLQAYKDRER